MAAAVVAVVVVEDDDDDDISMPDTDEGFLSKTANEDNAKRRSPRCRNGSSFCTVVDKNEDE